MDFESAALSLLFVALSTSIGAAADPLPPRLQTYIGLTEEDLVQRMGPPDFVYESAEAKYLAYEKSASAQTNGNNSYRTIPGSSGFARPRHCQLGFKLQNDHVVTYRYEGEACAPQLGVDGTASLASDGVRR